MPPIIKRTIPRAIQQSQINVYFHLRLLGSCADAGEGDAIEVKGLGGMLILFEGPALDVLPESTVGAMRLFFCGVTGGPAAAPGFGIGSMLCLLLPAIALAGLVTCLTAEVVAAL